MKNTAENNYKNEGKINRWLGVAALFGFLYVALSAFGAHVLSDVLSQKAMITYGKGAKYLMFNCFALTVCSLGITLFPTEKKFRTAAWLFLSGTLLFSGSLFTIVFSGIRTFGAITPIGGILQLSGWVFLAIIGLKTRK